MQGQFRVIETERQQRFAVDDTLSALWRMRSENLALSVDALTRRGNPLGK